MRPSIAAPVRAVLARLASVFLAGALSAGVSADELRVAVASNFALPAKALTEAFARATGHRATLSTGSTGKFYAQIRSGAPFDVLLAADSETPARLIDEKLALAGSRRTYALGRLVLWSRDPARVDAQGDVLRQRQFRHLAIANPRLAPYGVAAQQVLTRLGLWDAIQPKLIQGENIAQTHQFVSTGNAELGFVALSQVHVDGGVRTGSAWVVPGRFHQPIRQQAVILARGEGKPAALALLEYLSSEEARSIIRSYGYDIES